MIMIARMMPMTYIMTMFTMVDNQDDDGYKADYNEHHNKGHDSLYEHNKITITLANIMTICKMLKLVRVIVGMMDMLTLMKMILTSLAQARIGSV